jgi:hypothetical protein
MKREFEENIGNEPLCQGGALPSRSNGEFSAQLFTTDTVWPAVKNIRKLTNRVT